jgi:hypothetical protein
LQSSVRVGTSQSTKAALTSLEEIDRSERRCASHLLPGYPGGEDEAWRGRKEPSGAYSRSRVGDVAGDIRIGCAHNRFEEHAAL